MKLRDIKIEKRLVPIFNGNRDLPANDQIVIHFVRIPGTSEKQRYKTYKFNASADVSLAYEDNLLVSTFVSKIENLEIGDQKIKDGKDLATASNPKLSELFTEIRDHLFPDDEELTEGESEA